MPAAAAPQQTVLKRLAAALAFVCLVLFLLAIEQKHAVAAWQSVRHDAAPAAGRAVDWMAGLPNGAAQLWSGLKRSAAEREWPDIRRAVSRRPPPLAAEPGDTVLRGAFAPADDAARDSAGALSFVGATLRFENGESLRTRPLRIAAGRESFSAAETFADRLNAPDDAQIELRRVVPHDGKAAVAPSRLCGGHAPGGVALLHRGGRVDLMLFRAGSHIGPDAPPTALCGQWSFTAR